MCELRSESEIIAHPDGVPIEVEDALRQKQARRPEIVWHVDDTPGHEAGEWAELYHQIDAMVNYWYESRTCENFYTIILDARKVTNEGLLTSLPVRRFRCLNNAIEMMAERLERMERLRDRIKALEAKEAAGRLGRTGDGNGNGN